MWRRCTSPTLVFLLVQTGSRSLAEFLERSRSCGLDKGLLGALAGPRGLPGGFRAKGPPGGAGSFDDGEWK